MKIKPNSNKENIIEKGMWHYVFFHGVLRFGVTGGILVAIINMFIVHTNLWLHIITDLVAFPLLGVLWGISMWGFIKGKMK